jgi:hypothetical protein
MPDEPRLRAGMPMSVLFERTDDGVVLPNWQPVIDEALQS